MLQLQFDFKTPSETDQTNKLPKMPRRAFVVHRRSIKFVCNPKIARKVTRTAHTCTHMHTHSYTHPQHTHKCNYASTNVEIMQVNRLIRPLNGYTTEENRDNFGRKHIFNMYIHCTSPYVVVFNMYIYTSKIPEANLISDSK